MEESRQFHRFLALPFELRMQIWKYEPLPAVSFFVAIKVQGKTLLSPVRFTISLQTKRDLARFPPCLEAWAAWGSVWDSARTLQKKYQPTGQDPKIGYQIKAPGIAFDASQDRICFANYDHCRVFAAAYPELTELRLAITARSGLTSVREIVHCLRRHFPQIREMRLSFPAPELTKATQELTEELQRWQAACEEWLQQPFAAEVAVLRQIPVYIVGSESAFAGCFNCLDEVAQPPTRAAAEQLAGYYVAALRASVKSRNSGYPPELVDDRLLAV